MKRGACGKLPARHRPFAAHSQAHSPYTSRFSAEFQRLQVNIFNREQMSVNSSSKGLPEFIAEAKKKCPQEKKAVLE